MGKRKNFAAVTLGKRKSRKKAMASRRNGKLGGRPPLDKEEHETRTVTSSASLKVGGEKNYYDTALLHRLALLCERERDALHAAREKVELMKCAEHFHAVEVLNEIISFLKEPFHVTDVQNKTTESGLRDAGTVTRANGSAEGSVALNVLEIAPDHAREGATMKCPKCGIDVFAHGETCPVSREGALQAALEALAKVWDEESSMSHDSAPSLCAAQLRRLADGKEN